MSESVLHNNVHFSASKSGEPAAQEALSASRDDESVFVSTDDFCIWQPGEESDNKLQKVSDWCISVQGTGDAEVLKQNLVEHVKSLGANGVYTAPVYERKTGASSIFRYKLHRYTCRPCIVRRADSAHGALSAYPDINAPISALSKAQAQHRDDAVKHNIRLKVLIPAVYILLAVLEAFLIPAGPWYLSRGFIVAVIAGFLFYLAMRRSYKADFEYELAPLKEVRKP
jgi:hypothetical protein